MKRFLLTIAIFISIISTAIFASAQNIIVNSSIESNGFYRFLDFLSENWQIIALVASEIAAMLPGKINGIIQAVIKIGTSIFQKKNNNYKN